MDDATITTAGIRVSVRVMFLPEQSDPAEGLFVWAYRVRIENRSARTVRLVARSWRIVDATGRTQSVDGPGVVGEQPVLLPQQQFEYTSGTPLATASGVMHGAYQMEDTATGEAFEVTIPAFSLDSPFSARTLH